MRAIDHRDGALRVVELPDLDPGPGEVRIAVAATAVNRADLLQRAGRYDPPPGASPILGLECAGTVDRLGPGARDWSVGDRVCALLSGGGYASQVVVPEDQCLPAGDLPFTEAAALPEAVCTAHDALFTQGSLAPGERVLIHAGASGVGTIAIQLCREAGCPCVVTAGDDAKIARCVALGASAGWNRHRGPFTDFDALTDGVDVVLDPVGAGYVSQDLKVLRPRGRIVLIGLLGGRTEPVDLGRVLVKRLRLIGTVLRSRSPREKAEVVAAVRAGPWADALSRRIRPVIDAVLPLERAEAAHARVASNRTVGKVVLTVSD